MTRGLFLCVLLVFLGHSSVAKSEALCKPVKGSKWVTFDFRETPLRDVTRWVSCARNLNIIFQTESLARRNVTWISAHKVRAKTLRKRYEAMLMQLGLRLSRRGAFLIVEHNG